MNSSGDLAIEDPSESTSWPGLPEGLGLGTDSSHCPGILRMDSYDFIVFFFNGIYDDFHGGIYDDLLMIY